MSWFAITAPFLVGLVLVFIPGLLVAVSMRMRGFDAVGIAPALSIAVIAISAIVAPIFGVSWALWVPFACAAVFALVGLGVGWVVNRLGFWDSPRTTRGGTPAAGLVEAHWWSREQAYYWASFVLGAILLARNTTNALGEPHWIAQTWDNVFHLNAIRYIADTANGSSLHVGSMTSGGETADFYPAAWHDVVSLVFESTGVSIPVAMSTVVLTVCAVVWPLSVLFMIRNIMPASRFTVFTVGVVSAGFIAFPLLLTYFGVLYPNLLGYSLMPIGIGVVTQMFRAGTIRRMSTVQAVFLGFFVALGIALAHPNAIMSLLVLIVPILAARLVLQLVSAAKKQTHWAVAVAQVLGISAIYAIIYYLWGVVRPAQEAGEAWGPEITQGQALGEMLSNQALSTSTPLWFITVLTLVGVYCLIRFKNRLLWILGVWGVLAYFYIAIRSLDWNEGRYEVVGVWYHDSYRVNALIPLVSVLLVACAAEGVSRFVRVKLQGRTWYERSRYAHHAIAVLSVLVIAAGTQTAPVLGRYIDRSFWAYAPSASSPLLTADEMNVLENLGRFVPEDAGIVVQAFNGGPLAYAYTGRKVSAYHTLWQRTADEDYIYQHLNQATTNPEVCNILRDDKELYFLNFGTQEINEGNHGSWYTGFNNLPSSGAATKVYQKGSAALYKITACS